MFYRPKREKSQNKSSIVAFFHEKNKDELTKLANELSDEAKDFFDNSIMGLVGQLPDEVADTTITMGKSALNQLLYSAMVTGYMTKSVEDKVKLERVFNGEEAPEQERTTLMDTLFKRPSDLN